MLSVTTALFTSAAAAALFLIARRVHRAARRRILLAGAALVATAGGLDVLRMPVVPVADPRTAEWTVFSGWSEPAVLTQARNALDVQRSAQVELVGPHEFARDAQTCWPGASFRDVPATLTGGVTVDYFLAEVRRLSLGGDTTRHFALVAPRSADVANDREAFRTLIADFPGIDERIVLLYAGEALPEQPNMEVRGDEVVPPGTEKANVMVKVTPPAGTAGVIQVQSFAVVDGVKVDAPFERVTLTGEQKLERSDDVKAPSAAGSSGLLITAQTPFGELLAFGQVSVRVAKPQFAVLSTKPGETRNATRLFEAMHMDVAQVEVNLAASDAATLSKNAKAMADYPSLVIDTELEPAEIEVLRASLALDPTPPSLLFLGPGGVRTETSYLLIFTKTTSHFGDLVSDGHPRRVLFYFDTSGSMVPFLPTVQRCLDAQARSLNHRDDGLMQVLCREDSGWSLEPLSGFYAEKGLAAIAGAHGRNADVAELGHALVGLKDNLAGSLNGVTDLVMFIDPNDVDRGAHLNAEQLQGLEFLVQHGITPHFVYASDPAKFRAANPTAAPYLRHDIYSPDTDERLSRWLFFEVLPRLRVSAEPLGLEGLTKEQAEMVQRLGGNQDLRLITLQGSLRAAASYSAEARRKVLLWAHLGASGSAWSTATPLLLREQFQISDKVSVPFVWLTADLGLEAAKLPANGSPTQERLRAALGDLFVTALTATSPRLRMAPVRVFSGPQEIMAVNDWFIPFRTTSSSVKAAGRVVGSIDDRRLDLLRWRINLSGSDRSHVGAVDGAPGFHQVELSCTDRDPRIGHFTATVTSFQPGPTLLRPGSLTADDPGSPTTASSPKSAAAAEPRGIPRSMYLYAVGFVLLALAGFVKSW
jgi:hypothetical protein